MESVAKSAPRIDDWVGPFEDAHGSKPQIELAEYLPPRHHPQYYAILTELIRVEMDRDWARHQPKPIDVYLARFPEIRADLKSLGDIAFEEYRLRRQAGDPALPDEYRSKFGVDVSAWPLFPIPKRSRKKKPAGS
jgi:eukaryotic-like serine/threonine-protein kinase